MLLLVAFRFRGWCYWGFWCAPGVEGVADEVVAVGCWGLFVGWDVDVELLELVKDKVG